jgi:hypothetical protein
MDEPKLPISPHDPHGWIGAGAAPIAVDDTVVAPGSEQAEAPADPRGESSHVVYCDNEEEISEGFAIALRIMGLKQSQ